MATSPTSKQRNRIVKELGAAKSDLRGRGLEVLVDFVLDRKLVEILDLDAAVEIVREGIGSAEIVKLIEKHGRPGWERQRATLEATPVTLGHALDDSARKRVADMIADYPLPRARWAKDAVDARLVRKLLTPVVQELLLSFSKRIESLFGGVPEGSAVARGRKAAFAIGDRVRARVEKRAGQVLDASKLVLGTFGFDLEARLQELVAEASHAATDELQSAFRKRIQSAEGKQILGEMRSQVLDRVLATPVDEILADVHVPWDEVGPLAQDVARELATRDALATAIRDELESALAVDGDRPVRELLAELGVVDGVRTELIARLDPLARKLAKSAPFKHWLADLLAV